MPDQLPRILIISSPDPTTSMGTYALPFYSALKKHGYEVDFLTKHRVKGHPEFDYLLDLTRWPNYIRYKLNKKTNRKSIQKTLAIAQTGGHVFDYGREDDPPIPPKQILKKIKKKYDIVFIVFWYQMISYQTIEAIYDKLHCQIHLSCVDNQAVAGGCHFIGDCPRLSEGCGCCPGLVDGGTDDFTRFNVEFRRNVLKHVRPIIYGNTHMQNINRRSALLRDYDRLETVYPLVDNEFYHPIEKTTARRQLNIDDSKKFILFFGCSVLSEERKGMRYLMEALTIFHEQLTEEQRHSVLLLIAGQFAEEIISKMPFEYRYLGYVDLTQLPTIYSAATAFVCPSVDDAGPSMVNQSLSCGTPIISFNIGTAIDMVLGQDTGYCAHLRDAADLEKGMMQLFNSTEERYQEICENCRKIALERTTDASFVKTLQALYEKYRL